MHHDVVWRCAWPLNAVCRVCPSCRRIIDKNESFVLHITELGILESLNRYVVSRGLVTLHDILFGTALCLSLEVVEVNIV